VKLKLKGFDPTKIELPNPDLPLKARLTIMANHYRSYFEPLANPPKYFNSWELLNNYNYKDNNCTRFDLPSELNLDPI
jgi:hypothetical protein